ncbi:MAG: UDP-glucose/GDP-mannose dehydrogenase family protein [Candidatus Thermoplasmatota archaeon]|nr:UDP-glucose/GDP-mannose dehydrogenase family protein [Candidatus Thermoplasmatota archaeon]
MNIAIVGTGYVGLVTGACFAKLGHKVICVDINREKIQKINEGVPPIFEKDLEELLTTYKKNIAATTDYKTAIMNSDITFICVGTPTLKNGSIDLSFVKDSTISIAKVLKEKKQWHLVVVKSTVLPGTTKNVVLPLLEKYSGKKVGMDIGLGMNPEFLKEGVAIEDFLKPDRIVIGAYDKKSREKLRELYKNFSCPIVETDLSSAEMIKYASNAFLATKISFINEIGNMCKKIGIDTYTVAEGMGLDKRIGRAFLDSGIGWGGSCFPKDIGALISWAQEIKEQTRIIQSTKQVNDEQPLKLVIILKKYIPNLRGKTIGVLGLAFKPNTDDIRESRAIPIIQQLINEGANIKAYDPEAMENFKKLYPNINYCTTASEALDSDAVLILTKWDEFKNLNYKGKIVFDGRRIEQAKKAKIYEGVCW